jgi:eukaryotic-like serine/threonine-protein kinase
MAKSQKDSLVGTRIREYEILELIGKGGMGAVYRARHIYLDEERAIKVIQSRLAGTKEFIDRFIREARILTRLHHPNLVQFYEFASLQEDIFFMVLEFLRGETVSSRIQRYKRISVDQAVKIIREAASGLHCAHQRGVVHRDISPDNLFLVNSENKLETTKVIDFGIAKPRVDISADLATSKLFLGKPEYCSPEQCGLLNDNETIDHRADIYSLGATFYHMLSGRLPFMATGAHGYLMKHVNETPEPPSTYISSVPQVLDDIILKTLSKNRDERPQSMEELINQLDLINSPPQRHTIAASLPISIFMKAGQIFANRYSLEKKIGEGVMGTVYKARDNLLEIPVALKFLNQQAINNDQTIERLKREVILARKVAHPNVNRVYDISEHKGTHYISMEYVEGQTLSQAISLEGPLSLESGIPILRQVLEGLQEAHRAGITHRGLKPENIMLDLNLKPYITDFGISTSTSLKRMTESGIIIGTPFYMAPEQFEESRVDHRVDIYSIGVIMYQMFTGKLPFEGRSPVEIILAHMKGDPQKPRDIIPSFPEQVESIILRAIQKDPSDRYQNIKDMLRSITELQRLTISGDINFPREAIAHKFIAERKYSRAIKFLRSLLKSNPENKDWKKLLQIAISEKTKRQLHKGKNLIRKNNLIQAQLFIDKISRLHTNDPKIVAKIHKLQTELNTFRQTAFDQHIKEAMAFLTARDWTNTVRSLESATYLTTDKQKVTEIRNKMLELQQQETSRRFDHELGAITRKLEILAKDQASKALVAELEKIQMRIDGILSELPSSDIALQLRTEILSRLNEAEHEIRIHEKFLAAIQHIKKQNLFALSKQLKEMIPGIRSKILSNEIFRVQQAIENLLRCIDRENFSQAFSILDNLFAEHKLGWLTKEKESLFLIVSSAEKMAKQKQQYKILFETGLQKYQERTWTGVISNWKKALELWPESEQLQEWILMAETKLAEETEEKIQAMMKSARLFLEKGQIEESAKLFDEVKNVASIYPMDQHNLALLSLEKDLKSALLNQNIQSEPTLPLNRKTVEDVVPILARPELKPDNHDLNRLIMVPSGLWKLWLLIPVSFLLLAIIFFVFLRLR